MFDLDGTLVDTAPDLARALGNTLDIEGLASPPAQVVRDLVGQGAQALIENAAARAGATFTAARLDELTRAFIGFYRVDIAALSRPFEGVEQTLEALAAGGAALSVCTNKRTDLSVALLEALGLAHRFAAIVGADAVERRKPHPDHFVEAVSRAGGEVSRSVMIGDSVNDVGAARAAGAPVAVMRYGYNQNRADDLGADIVLDGFADIPAWCRSVLGRLG